MPRGTRLYYFSKPSNPLLLLSVQTNRSVLMRIVKYVSLTHGKLISLHKLSPRIKSIINMMNGLQLKIHFDHIYLLFPL